MSTISVRFDDKTTEKLRDTSKRLNMSVTSLIRLAVEDILLKHGETDVVPALREMKREELLDYVLTTVGNIRVPPIPGYMINVARVSFADRLVDKTLDRLGLSNVEKLYLFLKKIRETQG